jgi:hypothetical protein
MTTAWHYKTVTSACEGATRDDGVASCTRGIRGASSGYRVGIDVTLVALGGTRVTTDTSTVRFSNIMLLQFYAKCHRCPVGSRSRDLGVNAQNWGRRGEVCLTP